MMFRIFLNIFYRPAEAFKILSAKSFSTKRFFIFYGLPLIVTGSLARTGIGLMRHEAIKENSLVMQGITLAALLFVINMAAYSIAMVLGALLISRLAPRYGSSAPAGNFLSVVVVAYTPFLIAQPFAAWVEYGQAISVAGLLYTMYLFALGVRALASVPGKHITGFTLVSFFILFGTFYIIALVSSGLFIFETC